MALFLIMLVLFHSKVCLLSTTKKDNRLQMVGFFSAWKELKEMVGATIKPFNFHDPHVKGISDSKNDNQLDDPGYKSQRMLSV